MNLTFETLDDRAGIEVIDRIDQYRYRLYTSGDVSPTPVATDQFRFPVGSAVGITTSAIVLPTVVPVYVRDDAGTMVAEVKHLGEASLSADTYSLELCTRIKTYLRAETELQITADTERTRIEFDTPTELMVGARSRHKQPATTVTTSDDPVDMMAAIETFGSALKTADPERSYPTLRGHPPTVEVGDRLDVPSELTPPDTGVRLELPPEYSTVFVAAPLSYYLGAELVPSESPRLTTDTGFEYPLDSPLGSETEIERTLKQLFFLDCVTRTEGYYEIDLHERSEIEASVDLDFADLYDRPLADQVAAYLSVPYDALEAQIPEWRLTTHVEPVAESVEQLPFVVDDLAIVRTHSDRGPQSRPEVAPIPEQEFTREDVITRSTNADPDGSVDYVEPQSSDTLEQAWIGESVPIGASKLTVDAFRNRLAREESGDDVITISIVLNDPEMDEERDIVDQVYGSREDVPFEVEVRRDLTTTQLRDLLTAGSDFFHYIGHTERGGFVCTDGKLDATTLETVGVDAFLLNACNSYHQGLTLIEKGAIGGIVTLNEVINEGAVRIGESVARLLNAGFPLRAALTIAREESVLGGQYIVVGDGGMTVGQSDSVTPNLLEIEANGDGFDVEIRTYATDEAGIGTVFTPYLKENDEYFLSSGSIETFHVSRAELARFLQLEEVPVRIDDELHWSSSLEISDVLF